MAYTFLQAKGYNIGDSIVDLDLVDDAQELLKVAEAKGVKILLTVDHMALITEKDKAVKTEIIERGMMGLDIGPKTIKMFAKEIASAKQILWNGPVGKVEDDRFKKGTVKIAKAVAKSAALTMPGPFRLHSLTHPTSRSW